MPVTFQPPPTYADPVLVNEQTGKAAFNPIWLKWFVDVAGIFSSLGSNGSGIRHNSLAALQGGAAGEFFHLTAAELADVVALVLGISTTVTLAAITGGGTNGSLTFVGGILTASVPPT